MAGAWKTVRVFISSTFRDMHAERDHLVKVTFPHLRQWCEQRRLHLVDIDLRWGVTKQEAENGKAIEICLKEIDDCRPFFINILGNRYGWTPNQLPEQGIFQFGELAEQGPLSITHLEILHAVQEPLPRTDGQRQKACQQAFFYFRQGDCLPQPESLSGLSAPETEEYRKTFFEPAAKDRSLDRQSALAELKTAIQQQHGSRNRVFEYCGAWDPTAENPEDQRLIGRLTNLDRFGERVEADLQRAIIEEFGEHIALLDEVDGLEEERSHHEAFIEKHTQVYVSRTDVETQLTEYILGDDVRPLVLSGPPGCGKSSILAHWVKHRSKLEIHLARFVGASPTSTSLYGLLKNLCREMVQKLDLTEEVETEDLDGQTRKRIQEMVVPDDPLEVLDKWPSFLDAADGKGKLVVVLDALNQLDGLAEPQEASWLPSRLPPNVRIIVSVLDHEKAAETGQPFQTLRAEGRKDRLANDWLDILRRRKFPEVRVPDLSDDHRRQIIRQMPSVFCKTLDGGQIIQLLSNPATRNPLFLTVALEELRIFGSFDRLSQRIDEFPCLGRADVCDITAALDQIYGQLLDRLERETDDWAPGLAPAVFKALACAREGLSERELIGILAARLPHLSDETRRHTLQVVMRQVRSHLMRKTMGRATIIDFYHRSFWKAVRRKYLAQPALLREGHEKLAAYFFDQPYYVDLADRPQAARTPNVRKLDELPWQLVHAACDPHVAADGQQGDVQSNRPVAMLRRMEGRQDRRDDLYSVLTDPVYWESKIEAEQLGVFALDEDLRMSLSWDIGWRPEQRTVIKAIQKAVATRTSQLLEPALAAPQIFAALLLEERPTMGPLHHLGAQAARKWRDLHPESAWFERLDGPGRGLAVRERRRLVGHQKKVTCCAPLHDGRRLVTTSNDGKVIVWQVASGRPLATLQESPVAIWWCSVSLDGQKLIAASGDGMLHVFDLGSYYKLDSFRVHDGAISNVAFLNDDQVVSAQWWGSRLTVSQLSDGAAVRSVETPQMSCCCFAGGAGRAAVGSLSGGLHVFDVGTGELLTEINVSSWPLDWCALAPDAETILTGCGSEINHWRISDQQKLATWRTQGASTAGALHNANGVEQALLGSRRGEFRVASVRGESMAENIYSRSSEFQSSGGAISCCSMAADGEYVVAGSSDGVVRIWTTSDQFAQAGELEDVRCTLPADSTTPIPWRAGKPLIHLADHYFSPELFRPYADTFETTSLSLSLDGAVAIVGYKHGLVQVLDPLTGNRVAKLRGHTGQVTASVILRDGRRAISAAEDHTLRVWDLKHQREIAWFDEAVFRDWRFSRGGRAALCRDEDSLIVWDLSAGRAIRRIHPSNDRIAAHAVSANGRFCLIGTEKGALTICDLRTGNDQRLDSLEEKIVICALSGDGSGAVACTEAGHVFFLWPISGCASGCDRAPRLLEIRRLLDCHVDLTAGRVIGLTSDGVIRLWNAADGACVAAYYSEAPLRCIATDGDFRAVLTCDKQENLHCLRLRGGGLDAGSKRIGDAKPGATSCEK